MARRPRRDGAARTPPQYSVTLRNLRRTAFSYLTAGSREQHDRRLVALGDAVLPQQIPLRASGGPTQPIMHDPRPSDSAAIIAYVHAMHASAASACGE